MFRQRFSRCALALAGVIALLGLFIAMAYLTYDGSSGQPILWTALGGSKLRDGELDILATMRWMAVVMIPLVIWMTAGPMRLKRRATMLLYRIGSYGRWWRQNALRILGLSLLYTLLALGTACLLGYLLLPEYAAAMVPMQAAFLGVTLYLNIAWLLLLYQLLFLLTDNGLGVFTSCLVLVLISLVVGWHWPDLGAWLPGSWGMTLRSRMADPEGYAFYWVWGMEAFGIVIMALCGPYAAKRWICEKGSIRHE